MTDQRACPICRYPVENIRSSDYGERLHVDCPRCGSYVITDTAVAVAERGKLLGNLSAWIRDQAENRRPPPLITSDSLSKTSLSFPEYSVSERLGLLLAALGRRSRYPGAQVSVVPERDYPICWANNGAELQFYIDTLVERGLVVDADEGGRSLTQENFELVVTSAGWQELDDRARTNVGSSQAFVAMSFSAAMREAYDSGIAPAVHDSGFRPYRVDMEPHSDRIDVKIMAEIRRSRFLVADVTEQKMGVYFEAGYALGLGLPVIWSVRKDDLANVHFDTRQYNHIVWETPEEFRARLRDFVVALIGPNTAKQMGE